MCLTVQFHRKPIKSYTDISVIKDQLSSKEAQEPWAISDILIDHHSKNRWDSEYAAVSFQGFFTIFIRYNNELHMEMLEQ